MKGRHFLFSSLAAEFLKDDFQELTLAQNRYVQPAFMAIYSLNCDVHSCVFFSPLKNNPDTLTKCNCKLKNDGRNYLVLSPSILFITVLRFIYR